MATLFYIATIFFMSSDRFRASAQIAFYLFLQLGKTALHDAAIKGNAEMVAYMMEQVNPNVDARDVVSRSHSTLLDESNSVHLCAQYMNYKDKAVVGDSETRSWISLTVRLSYSRNHTLPIIEHVLEVNRALSSRASALLCVCAFRQAS